MSIGPEIMLARIRAAGVAGLFAQQGDHVAGIDAPVVPQHVGDLAFQQETVGEQLVAGHARQVDVFDRMAERPVAQVVQQRGGNERLGLLAASTAAANRSSWASCFRYSSARRYTPRLCSKRVWMAAG